ncbi:MAG TPA: tRNA pseudouridine(55) synthase TruB [Kiritimatiellae bacterium]|nr:tRNA pseudouridine(55) synthase TruB [Kiritimatiellia bacterium]
MVPPSIPRRDIDGLLLVDKPTGMTSHDVVDAIRRKFQLSKVGHGGTLDPMATGLLVILLGRGTRLFEQVMSSDKEYRGTLHLGITTDSHDRDGEAIATGDYSDISREMVQAEMEKWKGDVLQTPPMISAIKKDGVPLYKLARRGREVERKPRLIHVYRFDLLDFDPPRARFRLKCTKGTYVRTLCHDVGRGLGCGAFLEELRRMAVGRFTVGEACSLHRVLGMSVAELERSVIPVSRFLLDESG